MRKLLSLFAFTAILLLSHLSEISAQNTCKPPATTITNVTQTSATVTTINQLARTFQVMYSSDMGQTWTTKPPFNGFNTTLTGLTPSTVYWVRARSICGRDTSEYSPIDTTMGRGAFKTLGNSTTECVAPKDFKVNSSTPFSIDVFWAAVPNATAYIVEYSSDEGTTWQATPPVFGTNTTITELMPGTMYMVRIKSICGAGMVSKPSNFQEVWTQKDDTGGCMPPNVDSLQVTNVRSNTATIRWAFPNNQMIAAYRLVLKDREGNVLREDTTFNVWSLEFTYQNLSPGTVYIVDIYGLCWGFSGLYSSETASTIDFKTTTPSNTCPAPRSLAVVEITEQSAIARWIAAPGVQTYVFEWSQDGVNWFTQEQSETTYNFWGLMPNTTYHVRVKSICTNNTESFYTQIVKFTTNDIACLAPQDMWVQKVNGNTISVTLSQPFNRRRAVKWWLNQINAVVAEGTSETDSNIRITLPAPNGVYTLCMQNICEFKDTITFSETICRTVSLAEGCPTPINLTYEITPQGVNVKWDVPLPNQVSNYDLIIRMGNRIRREQSWTNNYMMWGLLNGVTYTVCVNSVCWDSTGQTSISDSVCTSFKYNFTSKCPAVTEHRAARITPNSADIFWGAVPGAMYYIIEISQDGMNWDRRETATASPQTIFDLQPGTKYFYRIITVCEGELFAEPSKIGEFETPKEFDCPKVTALRVSQVTTTTARVDWRVSNNAPITNFEVYLYWFDGNEWQYVNAYFPTRPPLELTGLTPNTQYGFVFRSTCISPDGDSTFSDTLIRVFKTLEDVFNCPKPLEVRITNITTTSARVMWAPPSQPGITYIVRYWKEGDPNNVTTVETSETTKDLTNLEPNTVYIVQVLSVCTNGGKPITSDPVNREFKTREQVIECPTPRDLTITTTETTGVLTWVGSQQAQSYEVWLQLGGEWTLVTTVNAPTTTYTFTNLVENTLYRARVRANCANKVQSDFSKVIEFTTKEKACPAPTNLRITNITYNSANASWTAVPGAVGYVVTYYKDGDPGSITTFDETNTSTNLAPLAANTKYIVQVRTRCEGGKLSNPSTTNFTTGNKPACNAPDSLRVNDITTNAALISWNGKPNAQSYEVRYRKVGDANYTTFNSIGTSRTLSNLASNTEYEFCVKTICAQDNSSDYSGCKTFRTLQVCAVPTNVRTTVVNIYDATVTWDVVPGAQSYELRITYSGNTITQTAVTNSATITGLTPRLSVEVQVRAICGDNNSSPYSNPLTFVTNGLPCATPTGLATLSITPTTAIITWNAAPNAVSYQLNITGPNNFNQTNPYTSPPAVLTNLTPNTTYTIKVRSVCADNATSEYSTVVTFTTQNFTCPTPTNVTVNNISATSGVVSWANAGQGYTYEVSYSTDGGTNYTTLPTTNQLTLTISNLPSSTLIKVRVRTVCGTMGQSAFATAEFRTLDAGTCSTPTGLTVTNITTNQALVSWDLVPGAVSYQLSYKDVNAQFFTTLNVTSNSRVVTNLTAGTDYVVRVRARCSAGTNPFTEWTELKSFTTQSETNVCGTPQIIDVVPTRNSATVSWTSVPGANGYRVAYSSNGGLSFINLPWTTQTSQTISNLSPGKEYLVRVRAKCTNNTQSPFSSAFLFTTLTNREEMSVTPNEVNLKVYPNPTRGNTNITFTSNVSEQVIIRLVDMTGREVYRQIVPATEGINDINTDFVGLTAGMYSLQLIQQGRTSSSKLMVE